MPTVKTAAPDQPTAKSGRSIAVEVIALIFLGAIAGTLATFAVLAISAIFAQLGNPTSTTFSEMVVSMLSRVFGVLTVWARAPLDGAKMGLAVGLAVSAAYVGAILLERSILAGASRWLTLVLLPIAGAVGAALGSQGVLADNLLVTAIGGALFGLAAAFVLRTD